MMFRMIAFVLFALLHSFALSGELRFANNTPGAFKVLVRPQSQTNWVAKTDQLQPNTETQPFTLAPNAYIVHLEYPDGTGQNFRPMRLGHLANTTIKINKTMETRNAESYKAVLRTRDDGTSYYEIQTETRTMTVEVIILVDENGEVIGNAEKKRSFVPRDPLGLTVALQGKSVVVTAVTPNSPANNGTDGNKNAASLKVGDLIEYINGTKPNTVDEFVTQVREGSTNPTILIRRNGSQILFETSLVGHIKEFNAKMYSCDKGLHIASVLDPNQPSRLRTADGTLAKLEPGDHIITINGQPAASVENLFILCEYSPNNLEVEILDKDGSTRWKLVYVR